MEKDSKFYKEKRIEEVLNNLLEKIIKNPDLNPPINSKKDFISDFNERCSKLNECIQKFADDAKNKNKAIGFEKLIEKSQKIQTCINETLNNYLAGDIKSAYDTFDNTFSNQSIISHLHRICVPLNQLSDKTTPLFRVRKSDQPLKERDDIFHIPFSKRHLVNAQRYSVAGLPCLYLGTSLYVCWLEMNKPDFDKLYISSFKAKDVSSKILNLASKHMVLPKNTNDDENTIVDTNRTIASYLIFWPLIIACNYIRQNPDSSFIQEYIIPNILMQWIGRKTSSSIIGVAYFSTKMPNTRSSLRSVNIVLPPKVTYDQTIKFKYCPKLSNLFNFTNPLSWQVLKTLEYPDPAIKNVEQARAKTYLTSITKNNKIKEIDDDLVVLYPLTDFYKLEICINDLFDHQTINNDITDGGKLAAEP
ncbi:hypothetical protein ACMS1M_003920 [Cronobacter dublinensis]